MEEEDRPSIRKERLHVGDSVKSVYVLDLLDGKLCDVARDYMQNWVVAMEELEANGGSVIISDVGAPLLSESRDVDVLLALV